VFAALLLLLLLSQSPPPCDDVASCRTAAVEAQTRKDYEAFHNLAWLAYRKGKQDDPELMLLLARAQSLSGRPGDAIVMLERLAARGIATDVETSEDFETVRSHPRWNKAPSGGEVPKAPAPVAPSAPLAPPSEAPRAPSAKKPSTLAFTTLLSPTALAYDAVSKRYLIADRQARRVAIVDENTGQVSTLAGAQARLGDIRGMAIDTRQGDLWVVSSSEEGTSLSRLQLISGRELSAARISGLRAPAAGVAFVRGTGLVVSDEEGDIWRVSASGSAEKLGSLEYAPKFIAADLEGTLYVTAGGQRLARYSVSPFRRLGVIDLGAGGFAGLPFAVVADRIHLVVPVGGSYEIRTVRK
jgi:hypothetical protein